MSFVFLIIIILSFALFASALMKKSAALTIPISVLSIICLLYLFLIFDILIIGFFLVIALSLLSLGFYIYLSVKKDKNSLKKLYSPPVIVFVILSLIIYLGTKNLYATVFDEFSHWALIVKNLHYFNALGDGAGVTVVFKEYPPAIALFQYFYSKLNFSFVEGSLYTAKGVIYASLLIIVLKDHEWKEIGRILLKSILVISLPLLFFNYFYHALYVDGLLGAFFAYIVIISFLEKPSVFSYVNISLAMFVICLVKPSGLWIGIIALSIFYINILRTKENRIGRKNIICLSAPLIAILLAFFSWKIFVNTHYEDIASNSIIIKYQEILNVISGNHKDYQYQTVVAFAKYLTEHVFSSYILRLYYTSYLILIGLIGTFFVSAAENPQERKKRKIFALAIAAGLLVFTVSLLFLYLFSFTETEAVGLAACQRYLSTYFFGGLASLVFLILLNKKKTSAVLIAILLIILIDFTPMMELTVLARVKSASTKIAMEKYEDIKDAAGELDYKNDKVYYLDFDASHSGYEYWVSKYLFTPVKINSEGSWRIGEKYNENDTLTYNIDSDEWAKILIDEKYTHVYILQPSEKFKIGFGQLFENGADSIREKSIYKIDKTEDTLTLVKIN